MNLKDFLFKTKDGKYVYGQRPNSPVVVAFGALAGSALTQGDMEEFFYAIFLICLAIWAVLEVSMGVNLFRRLLGGLVIGFIFWRLAS